MKTLTEPEILKVLRERQGDQTQAQFASRLGVSVTLLSEILRGIRRPAPSVVRALGYEPKTVYVKVA